MLLGKGELVKGSGSGILDARIGLLPPSVRLLGKYFHAFAVGAKWQCVPLPAHMQNSGFNIC